MQTRHPIKIVILAIALALAATYPTLAANKTSTESPARKVSSDSPLLSGVICSYAWGTPIAAAHDLNRMLVASKDGTTLIPYHQKGTSPEERSKVSETIPVKITSVSAPTIAVNSRGPDQHNFFACVTVTGFGI